MYEISSKLYAFQSFYLNTFVRGIMRAIDVKQHVQNAMKFFKYFSIYFFTAVDSACHSMYENIKIKLSKSDNEIFHIFYVKNYQDKI